MIVAQLRGVEFEYCGAERYGAEGFYCKPGQGAPAHAVVRSLARMVDSAFGDYGTYFQALRTERRALLLRLFSEPSQTATPSA